MLPYGPLPWTLAGGTFKLYQHTNNKDCTISSPHFLTSFFCPQIKHSWESRRKLENHRLNIRFNPGMNLTTIIININLRIAITVTIILITSPGKNQAGYYVPIGAFTLDFSTGRF